MKKIIFLLCFPFITSAQKHSSILLDVHAGYSILSVQNSDRSLINIDGDDGFYTGIGVMYVGRSGVGLKIATTLQQFKFETGIKNGLPGSGGAKATSSTEYLQFNTGVCILSDFDNLTAIFNIGLPINMPLSNDYDTFLAAEAGFGMGFKGFVIDAAYQLPLAPFAESNYERDFKPMVHNFRIGIKIIPQLFF